VLGYLTLCDNSGMSESTNRGPAGSGKPPKDPRTFVGDTTSARYVGKKYIRKNQGRGSGRWGQRKFMDQDPRLVKSVAPGATCWATVTVKKDEPDATGGFVVVKRRCKNPPMPHQRVCRFHGGTTSKALVAAGKRAAVEEGANLARKLGARVEADPRTVLLEQLYVAYGMTSALGAMIQEFTTEDLTSQDDKHRAQVWSLQGLLGTWQERAVSFAAIALKAGIEERLVQVAESQATAMVAVIRAAIANADLDPDSRDRVLKAIAIQMRTMASSGGVGGVRAPALAAGFAAPTPAPVSAKPKLKVVSGGRQTDEPLPVTDSEPQGQSDQGPRVGDVVDEYDLIESELVETPYPLETMAPYYDPED